MKESERLVIFNSMSKIRRKNFVEQVCGPCEKLRWYDEKEYYWCEAYNMLFFLWGNGLCPAQEVNEDLMAKECFSEDQHRELLKPGGGDRQDRTHKLFGKDRMKDNRPVMWDGKLD